MARQSEWPRVKREPEGCFQSAMGLFESNRKLAGPLRTGTAPGVGPRGRTMGGDGSSDLGMDRLELRPVDRMGQKYPEVDPPVKLISERTRNYAGSRSRRSRY